MVVVYVDHRDQITWNTIPVSEQKNTLNNQILNNRTTNRTKESTESNKKKTVQTKVKQ
jgi:hypothetical protein